MNIRTIMIIITINIKSLNWLETTKDHKRNNLKQKESYLIHYMSN